METIKFIIYNICLLLGFLIYNFFKILFGKFHKGTLYRFGNFNQAILESGRNIWIHAVSVGELNAIEGLIQRLKSQYPQYQLVISTTTKNGHELASKNFKNDVVVWAPLDITYAVKKTLRKIKPVIYLTVETEIWPNLIRYLKLAQCPIIQINGRISDVSYEGYGWIKCFIKDAISKISLFSMQSQNDAQKIIKLGAEKNRVKVLGNLKFDQVSKENSPQFALPKEYDWWIAGSTHPGEEQIIYDLFKALLFEFPNLRLLLAPRHVERTSEVLNMIDSEGFIPVKFSQMNSIQIGKDSIVVLDTIGQLRTLYQFAKVVFVGKSLVGQGGQNIIEPATFGKPIVVGPYMQNFQDVVDLFLMKNAIIQVKDSNELFKKVKELLLDAQQAQRLGESALKVVQENRGATQRTLEEISKFLPI